MLRLYAFLWRFVFGLGYNTDVNSAQCKRFMRRLPYHSAEMPTAEYYTRGQTGRRSRAFQASQSAMEMTVSE
jgi:hypothetical protein